MDASPDLGLLYRELVPFSITLFHIVELLFTSPFIFQWLPELEAKIFSHFVDEGHRLKRVETAVDFSRIEKLCIDRTPERKGGIPPIEPLKLYKLYLVMFLLNIPGERELCRRAKADLAIRWFCGFGLLGRIPVHSTLTKFRQRMGQETFQTIFQEILRQCVEAGLVPGREIAFDASKMEASATPVAPFEQACRVLQAFLEELFETAQVEPASEEDRENLREAIKRAAKSVGMKVKDADRFWKHFQEWRRGRQEPQGEDTGELPSDAKVTFPSLKPKELAERIKRILARLPHAVGDLDVRYGHTSDKKPFLGYLFAFIIDTARNVITSVVFDPGNTHCSKQFDRLYGQHQKNLNKAGGKSIPDAGTGDTGYDEIPIHRALLEDLVEVFIAMKQRENKHGVYSTDRFRLNEEGQLICPAGLAMTPGAHRDRKDGTVIYRCPDLDCPHKSSCTTSKRRTVEINPDSHRVRQEAIERQETEEFKAAMIRRLLIEGVFGHGKCAHHLDQAHYRDRLMNEIQTLTGATSMNIEKLVSALANC